MAANDVGYEFGDIDGNIGKKAVVAANTCQIAEELPVNGFFGT